MSSLLTLLLLSILSITSIIVVVNQINKIISNKANNKDNQPTYNDTFDNNTLDSDIINKNITEYYPACESSYTSLVDALKSIDVDSSFETRKKIAIKNGIIKNGILDYTGTPSQNIELLN